MSICADGALSPRQCCTGSHTLHVVPAAVDIVFAASITSSIKTAPVVRNELFFNYNLHRKLRVRIPTVSRYLRGAPPSCGFSVLHDKRMKRGLASGKTITHIQVSAPYARGPRPCVMWDELQSATPCADPDESTSSENCVISHPTRERIVRRDLPRPDTCCILSGEGPSIEMMVRTQAPCTTCIRRWEAETLCPTADGRRRRAFQK